MTLEIDKAYYIYTADRNVFKGTFKQMVRTEGSEGRVELYHFGNCELYVGGEPREPIMDDMWFVNPHVKYFTSALIP